MRALALATLLVLAPVAVLAADWKCDTGQGVEVILDHQYLDKKPLPMLPLRQISRRCIDGPTVFKFKHFLEIPPLGLPFRTEAETKEVIDLLLKLNLAGVKPEQVAAALKAAAEVQTRADTPTVAAKKQ